MGWIVLDLPEDLVGSRLDAAVFRLLEDATSRSMAAKLVAAGGVRIGGTLKKNSYILRSGDLIELNEALLEPSSLNEVPHPEKIPLDVVFEDSDLLVINKPAGLVVHPGAGVASGTLVNAVLDHCGVTLPSLGAPSRAGIVHRLDKDTSGVMVVAKSQLALTRLSLQFATHAQERVYEALTFGCPGTLCGRVETNHGRDPRHRMRYAVLPVGGKAAITEYATQETFYNKRFALLECRLHTGRTHQIRVHMRYLGNPILGDALYAPEYQVSLPQSSRAPLLRLLKRQMLHARKLGFLHPRTEQPLVFDVPVPQDFQDVLALLRCERDLIY